MVNRGAMRRLSHTAAPIMPVESVGAAIDRCSRAMQRARVHFGHGTDNARDEAAELVFFVAGIAHAEGNAAYGRPLTTKRRARIDELLRRRIDERIPLAYLTGRAFFAGLELYVDARVLVPRSPIAELVLNRFRPWAPERRIRRILDLGCGSGAIALASAHAFPQARVDAIDICTAALAVCRRNIRRLGLGKRVEALRSDHFAAVRGRRYDIIVSNPPYVGHAEMRRLPREYRYEPRLGLSAGTDGLDSVRAIFSAARPHLVDDGILVVEVGNTEHTLVRAFPQLPFMWPNIAMGGGGVFVLRAVDLPDP